MTASGEKSEETLVLTQSAIGEKSLATELQRTITQSQAVSCVRREETLASSQIVIGEIILATELQRTIGPCLGVSRVESERDLRLDKVQSVKKAWRLTCLGTSGKRSAASGALVPVTSQSAAGEIDLATHLQGPMGDAWQPLASKPKRLLFPVKV